MIQPLYTPLTLGSIKPQGWLKDQLELGANGLGGNMFEFYRFVHNSRWIGGEDEYSGLAEASPYWFNGVVPLAFGLDDDRLKDQVRYYLDYVLDHQQEDGWLGFETTPQERGLWGRCLLLLGLIVSISAQEQGMRANLHSNMRKPIPPGPIGSSTRCIGTFGSRTVCSRTTSPD